MVQKEMSHYPPSNSQNHPDQSQKVCDLVFDPSNIQLL